MRRVPSLETLVARRPSLKEGLRASIEHPPAARARNGPNNRLGDPRRVLAADVAAAACRSTGRSRTTAGRATCASYDCRSRSSAKSATRVHSLVSAPRAWHAVDCRHPLARTSSSSSLSASLARANARPARITVVVARVLSARRRRKCRKCAPNRYPIRGSREKESDHVLRRSVTPVAVYVAEAESRATTAGRLSPRGKCGYRPAVPTPAPSYSLIPDIRLIGSYCGRTRDAMTTFNVCSLTLIIARGLNSGR